MSVLDTLGQLSAPRFWLFLLLLGLGAAVSLIAGFISISRARFFENTPTSRIATAAQGYVELEGCARLMPGPPITALLTGARCCWYRYRIEYRDREQRRNPWQISEEGNSEELFALADGSAECAVDPHGAHVIPSVRYVWYGNRVRPDLGPKTASLLRAATANFRYTEELLEIGTPLYAAGLFRSQRGAEVLNDPRADLRDLLAKWKRDRHMMKKFDLNQDGVVDIEEWELARRAARDQVQAAVWREMPGADVHVLAQPPDGRPYILSALSQSALVRRKRWQGIGLLMLALVGGALSATLVVLRVG